MKTPIVLILLTWAIVVQANNLDWHIYVPSEGVSLGDVYGDHNQAIIQGFTNQFYPLDFEDYTSFLIPDQSAVSAFALEPTGESFAVWLSLSTPVDRFLPGDIIRCFNTGCELVFRAQEILNIADTVAIDALDVSEELVSFSFNVGFTYENEYIDPMDIYALGSNGPGNLILVAQNSGQDLGFSEAANMSSYDKSPNRNNIDFSYFFGSNVVYKTNNDTTFTNEMLRFNSNNPAQPFPMGISEDIKTISAFYSLNSGYVGLVGESIDVNENAGTFEVELYRMNGSESYIQVLIESTNGTAIESVDFQFMPSTAEWFGGDDNNQSITVDIIDNQLSDGIRTFYLHVFPASQFASIISVHEVIEIRIIDDEGDDLIFKDGFE